MIKVMSSLRKDINMYIRAKRVCNYLTIKRGVL